MNTALSDWIRRQKICYLCGLGNADTKEHVIPRNLYPEPRKLPSDVLTLPAHFICNRHTHLHEEAFRDFIASGISSANPGHALWSRTWKALHRPEAKRRQESFYKDIISQLKINMQGGSSYVPIAVTLKDERVHWVLSKIIKGLYTHVTGGLLVDRKLVWSFGQLAQGSRLAVDFPNIYNIHDVLDVRWMIANDQPLVSLWVLDFYATQRFHITTIPTELHAQDQWCLDATQLIWPGPDNRVSHSNEQRETK